MAESDSNPEWDNKLPSRLFATDRYPEKTLNIYSQPDYLLRVRRALEGTDALNTIRGSHLGRLWDLQYHLCHMSGKLVHGLIGRQLVTNKRHEMWTVFGGQPMRFSLLEFESVTGLDCGHFPDEYDLDAAIDMKAEEVPLWEEFFGKEYEIKIADVCKMLETEPNMPPLKKLHLALIVIVDGVLNATQQRQRMTPTPSYVALLTDVDSFLRFPWGRESFLRTIECMIPGEPKKRGRKAARVEDPVEVLRKQLQQDKVRLTGFPLALQLLAFKQIPVLVSKVTECRDKKTLFDVPVSSFPLHKGIVLESILAAENDSSLIVEPMVYGDAEWDVEIINKKTSYMEELIGHGHLFTKPVWPGGDATLPLFVYKPKKPTITKRTHVTKEKCKKHEGKLGVRTRSCKRRHDRSTRRQTKIDEFLAAPSTSDADPRVQIAVLTMRVKSLERQLRKRDSIMSGKFSSKRRHLTQRKTRKESSRVPVSDPSPSLPSVQIDLGSGNLDGVKGNRVGGVPASHCGFDSVREVIRELDLDNLTDNSDGYIEANTLGVDSFGMQSACVDGRGMPSDMWEDTAGTDQIESIDSPPVVVPIVDRGPLVMSPSRPFVEKAIIVYVPPNDAEAAGDEEFVEDLDAEQEAAGGEEFVQDLDAEHHAMVVYVSPTTQEGLDAVADVVPQNAVADGNGAVDEPDQAPVVGGPNVPQILPINVSLPGDDNYDSAPSMDEIELGYKFLLTPKRTSNHPLPTVDKGLFRAFEQTLTPLANVVHKCHNQCTFDNAFLLALAEKGNPVSTKHMEILTYLVTHQLSETLELDLATFATPLLLELVMAKKDAFEVAKNPKLVRWHEALRSAVNASGAEWLVDIDTVYVPYMLPDHHWIGLAINLKMWVVEVLDPNGSLISGRQLKAELGPILKMLPYVLRKYCHPQVTQSKGYHPLVLVREKCYYKRGGCGDSGPLAMKLLELHARGVLNDEMTGITDWKVSELRKQYAIDIYREMVLDLHFPV